MIQTNPGLTKRIAFLDHLRYLMVLLVVVYHSVAAYSKVAPHWTVHDNPFLVADLIRQLLDVFIMPSLFFVAGYFTLPVLEKKGIWGFLEDKAKRLLIPWVLLVLIFSPLIFYDQPTQVIHPFRRYWIWYVDRFQSQLNFLPPTQPNQSIYWFLSLLFIFFVLFAFVYSVFRRFSRRSALLPRETPAFYPLLVLALFGLGSSVIYFATLLLFPDTSWFTLGVALQFEPTRLLLLVGYFLLGVYAQSRGWFAGKNQMGPPVLWGVISTVLAIVYLVVGQKAFANPAGTPFLSVNYLLVFAFIRSFLLTSLVILFISYGLCYWNQSGGFDRALTSTSYNIYLTHIWFVVIIQTALLTSIFNPSLKFAIVLLFSILFSFLLSRWVIGRWPKVVVATLLALFVFCLFVRP